MEGRLILERFRLGEELGRGGFGTVYRARDERLQRDVAVKVLDHGPGSHRVLREAQAAARLNHPHILPVFESGEVGPFCYLVMAYCAGGRSNSRPASAGSSRTGTTSRPRTPR